MNYVAHYDKLIARARSRILTGYKERHHIVPRCMKGDNSPQNLVDLTPEEHYVAHQLLVKMHPEVSGLAIAAVRMAKQCTGNKAYGWLRRLAAISVSKAQRGNTHALGKRWTLAPFTPEHRAKISAAAKLRTYGPISQQQREQIAAANRTRKFTPEMR